MSIKALTFSLLLLIFSFNATPGNLSVESNPVVDLTNEEKKWIKEHPDISVALRHGWAPVEFLNESNKPIGLSVSFLKSIEKLSGLHFISVQAHDNGPLSEDADVIASVPSKLAFGNTKYNSLDIPYISIPYAIFTNNNIVDSITSLEDLKGKKVAVFKTGKVVESLEKNHPEITLVKVDIATEALEGLTLGSVDAYIGNMLVVSYNAKNEGFGNITLSAETPYSANIYMGIRNDWPILHSILTKSLEAIPQEQKNAMITNWSGVRDGRGFSYVLILKVSLALLIFSVFIAIWNWQLKKEVKQRRLVEEQLRLLSTSVQQIHDIVVITDAKPNDQRIVFVNDAFEQKTGYTREEAIGKSPKILQGPKSSKKSLAKIRKALSEWQPIRLELINYTKHGDDYWLDLEITPVMESNGAITNWMSIERDISEQKATEIELIESKKQAESASVAKSNFLANMSHEIRTPMNAVLGMTTLLLDTELDETQLEYLNTVNNSASALLDIMNDVLDSSKIEAGKLEIAFVEFSLHKIVDACVEMFASAAHEKDINLIYYVDINIVKRVVSDPVRIRQILVNLLSNAIKFTEKGSVFLQVNSLRKVNGVYDVEIKVTDSGIGMSQEVLDILYQPFTQADSSISKQFGGTGLGLSISKELANMMNGSISAESKINKGTIFTVNLPLELGEDNVKWPKLKWMSGKKVLIIDENSLRANAVKNYLDFIDASVFILEFNKKPQMAEKYDLIVASSKSVFDEAFLIQALVLDYKGVRKLLLANQFRAEAIDLFSPNAVLNEPFKQLKLYKTLEVIFDHSHSNTAVKSNRRSHADSQLIALNKSYQGTVLIVDDNPLNLQVASALLKKMGVETQEVSSGKNALKVIEVKAFSLVLMDCQMPGLDGFEVTKLIRNKEVGTNKRIPIVALTASAMEGDEERCLAAGMDDYLAKPIDIRRLRAIVDQWMEAIEKPDPIVEPVKKKRSVLKESSAVMNESVLKNMFQDDENTINGLLEQFLIVTPTMLDKLECSINASDMSGIAKCCHQIKGSSSTYGFEEFSNACVKLEQAAKGNKQEVVNLLFKDVMNAFMRLSKYLSKRSKGR